MFYTLNQAIEKDKNPPTSSGGFAKNPAENSRQIIFAKYAFCGG